jgi:sarcosine oxidase delta subunit
MRNAISKPGALIVLFAAVVSGGAQTPQAPVPRSRYSPTAAAQEQGQAQQQSDTWYEFLLKQFNPKNLDFGTWLEERRRAFLEATFKNPYFLYSFWLTVWSLLVMCAHAKLWIDRRRERFVTEEMMTDLYNHDLYSREAAKEAIERHNQHIERCNRVIEAAESGQSVPGTTGEIGEMRQRLQRLGAELATTVAERDKAKEQLEHKSALIAEMSLRMDGLGKKGNGNATQEVDVHGSSQDLIAHVNRLQQELYAERRKNQRLKGA